MHCREAICRPAYFANLQFYSSATTDDLCSRRDNQTYVIGYQLTSSSASCVYGELLNFYRNPRFARHTFDGRQLTRLTTYCLQSLHVTNTILLSWQVF